MNSLDAGYTPLRCVRYASHTNCKYVVVIPPYDVGQFDPRYQQLPHEKADLLSSSGRYRVARPPRLRVPRVVTVIKHVDVDVDHPRDGPRFSQRREHVLQHDFDLRVEPLGLCHLPLAQDAAGLADVPVRHEAELVALGVWGGIIPVDSGEDDEPDVCKVEGVPLVLLRLALQTLQPLVKTMAAPLLG